ncbi:protein RMD5 A [Cladorrhinum samala]|uniref:GID complex catalytic subunit 2 n=1 Tax=Cladorrhinum samala TaxID=585594 RepID=A0AAV9HPS2_9PEZI|nr:protein RMD5 A [Cladorrhinum samala]
MASEKPKLETLQKDFEDISKLPRLSAAVENVDKIIQLLSAAREQVAGTLDTHTAGPTMIKLQNPIKSAFESIENDLKKASAAHKKMGKALNESFPLKPLPMDHDAMADHVPLINRAIAMHLLREGQFSVASTFINEVQGSNSSKQRDTSADLDETMDEAENAYAGRYMSASPTPSDHYDLSSLHSRELHNHFSEMYSILQHLKAKDLDPAIAWAGRNSAELEARGSNLEFELSKLKYIWLFKGPAVNGLPDDDNNGFLGALTYARKTFSRFGARHLAEIQKLVCAMAYAPNLSASPYASTFATDSAFADVASSFTREFCSLLGLSAESPLYLAATAGALALPQLMKYTQKTRAKGTEWTTANELAFETPLPESMLYHSIFVCPVSKEQTTDANPPMMIPCGHVLAKETLARLCKGTRFKCPYCPSEGLLKDARQIIL